MSPLSATIDNFFFAIDYMKLKSIMKDSLTRNMAAKSAYYLVMLSYAIAFEVI